MIERKGREKESQLVPMRLNAATNVENAMYLEAEDRRVCVISNGITSRAQQDALRRAAIDPRVLASFAWHCVAIGMTVEEGLSTPPMTPAKARMIRATQNPAEVEARAIVDDAGLLPSPFATTGHLKAAIIRHLEVANAAPADPVTVNMLLTKIKKLCRAEEPQLPRRIQPERRVLVPLPPRSLPALPLQTKPEQTDLFVLLRGTAAERAEAIASLSNDWGDTAKERLGAWLDANDAALMAVSSNARAELDTLAETMQGATLLPFQPRPS